MLEDFSKFYTDRINAIFRFCLFRVSDRETAIDLSQEVFMKYWDYLADGREIKNPNALLFRIARNLIIDWYKKKKNVLIDDLGEDFLNNIEFSINHTETESEAREIIEKINLLDKTYREVVYLKLVEELQPREIAEILNLSSNVVSVRINRGIAELKNILKISK